MKTKGDRALFWRLCFWAALAGISVLALLPNESVTLPFNVWDKLNHVAAFVVLLSLGAWSYTSVPVLRLTLALFGYGLLLELAQGMVGYRSASLADIVANSLGLLLGAVLLALIRGSLSGRLSPERLNPERLSPERE